MSIQHGIALTGTITLLASIIMVAEPVASAPTKTEMVAMRDGTKLVTDIYLPGNNENGKYPVVVIRTPYPREGGQDMTNAGYAVVFQSTRGRFGSEGKDLIFFDDGWGANKDGYDAIEWVAKQPWCNGKIGTFGASAPAIMQYRLAGSGSPNVDTQAVIFGGSNLYHHLFFQGGAFRAEGMIPWIESCQFTPDVLKMIHEHPAYDDYWRNYDLSTRYGKVNMPMLHMAGWYDILLQGNIDAFMGAQYHGGEGAKGKQKIVIGPSSHAAFDKVGEIEFPNTAKHNPFTEVLGWLEYQLQGKDNDMAKQSAVTYYVMGATGEKGAPGNEWRSSDVWPVPSKATPYYLHKDGSLGTSKSRSKIESRSFKYNPDNPVPTIGGQNLLIGAGPVDQRIIEDRPDVLLFTTKPLTAPVEVTGRVKVKLWASSSAKDTDFTAKLTDVYPDGRSMLICDGVIRARYRNSFEKPELMEPGKIYEFEIDLWSTSMIFNKGHKIRLAISSSNSPRFDANPNTGEPVFDAKRKEIADNTVYFDTSHPSAIILPVVKPAK